jgi:hypothetical protein
METKTQKTARVNKVVNAKTTTKVVNKVNTTTKKVEVIKYLKDGVTGKQMMKAIYDANNRHKQDLGTFSQCLKRAIEFGSEELTANIAKLNVKDWTPKNLIPLRNEKRGVDASFSVYEVLMLIKKFYQTK